MIERDRIKPIMKNSGTIMVALTIVAGIIYMILDLYIIVEIQGNLLLRALGVGIVAVIAYIPYFVSQKILLSTKYLSFFWGFWFVFVVGDAIMRIDLIALFFQLPGFFGIIMYPILFTIVITLLFVVEVLIRKCAREKKYCYKLTGAMKKKYSAVALKLKKV